MLLGVAGSKLAADDPTRYARLRQDLLAAARGAQDADRKTSLLLSLGNTKDASLAVEVASFLADGDLRVRRAAAQASGSLGIDTIAAPLMKRLAVEPNDVVRAAVIGAMTSWSKPPVEAMRAMRDLADQEQDGGVRQQVARVLAKHLGSYPENAEAMRRMLETEQSEATRRTLASALASAGLR